MAFVVDVAAVPAVAAVLLLLLFYTPASDSLKLPAADEAEKIF